MVPRVDIKQNDIIVLTLKQSCNRTLTYHNVPQLYVPRVVNRG